MNKRILTPVGTALWSSITKPDGYSDKYQISIKLSKEDAKAFIDLTDEMSKKMGVPNKTYKEEDDTGLIRITAKMKSSYIKNGKTVEMKPNLFDDAGKKIDQIEITNRSKIKLALQVSTYESFGGGVSVRLEAVQLIELFEETEENDGFTLDAYEDIKVDNGGEDNPFGDNGDF